ncbi:sigma-E factor negative regulatory protein [Shewanella aestuarii]|uniref:Anti-sigma-E factor RseA n=1 Tax=Shewanella aestuarii TaxID=1028752 RepID=A0A6G9QN41_9GAMM|nr:anti sigma-E factor RseA C-terminal domain-containing protein [Shewanella aestuarii]QIR15241.1 anti-sigma factor [Shewanella aestuarii]
MVKSSQEWVSAAVDGEVDEQTLAQLSSDVDSHDEWHRYHMIGDTMRGELPAAIDLDITASIAAAIDLEPTIVAPQVKAKDNIATTQPQSRNNVVSLFKQFGQYAIAASVALVAIIGVQTYNLDQDVEDPLPVFNTRPLVGTVSPVSLQTGPVANQQGFTNEQVVEQRRRINAYIQDHMLQQRLNNGLEVEDQNFSDLPLNQ